LEGVRFDAATIPSGEAVELVTCFEELASELACTDPWPADDDEPVYLFESRCDALATRVVMTRRQLEHCRPLETIRDELSRLCGELFPCRHAL
jgi:hypothetical protein